MLTTAEVDLLRRVIDDAAPTLAGLVTRDAVALPLETRNELRGAIADYLTKYGFDEDWKPTQLGYQLESLIDRLGPT